MDGVNKTCFCLLGPTVRFIQEHRFEVGSFWIICFAVEMLCWSRDPYWSQPLGAVAFVLTCGPRNTQSRKQSGRMLLKVLVPKSIDRHGFAQQTHEWDLGCSNSLCSVSTSPNLTSFRSFFAAVCKHTKRTPSAKVGNFLPALQADLPPRHQTAECHAFGSGTLRSSTPKIRWPTISEGRPCTISIRFNASNLSSMCPVIRTHYTWPTLLKATTSEVKLLCWCGFFVSKKETYLYIYTYHWNRTG